LWAAEAGANRLQPGVTTEITSCDWSVKNNRKVFSCGLRAPHPTARVNPAATRLAGVPTTKAGTKPDPVAGDYLVVALGERGATLAKLRDLNDEAFTLLRRFPHQNRISLGVYSQIEPAMARQARLHAQGIDSEIINTAVTAPSTIETTGLDETDPGSIPGASPATVVEMVATARSASKARDEPLSEDHPDRDLNQSPESKVSAVRSGHAIARSGKIAGQADSGEPGKKGYLVLATGATPDTVARLTALQDKHFLVLSRPPHKNRVSLGVYNQIEAALTRQRQLAARGVEAQLYDRSESGSEPLKINDPLKDQHRVVSAGVKRAF